ncbi:MAG: DUF3754 domain-containing protein [Planctomycetia bacterium]|jgi:hypothetical protein
MDQETPQTVALCQNEDELLRSGIFTGSLQELLQRRDRFIPVHLQTIIDHALKNPRLREEEKEGLANLFTIMRARFHFEFHSWLNELLDDYGPFDPDTDLLFHESLSEEELDQCRARFSSRVHDLLIQGNYTQLSREQLQEILELQPLARIAIRVNLDDFRDIRIYYRGVDQCPRPHQGWKRWMPGWFRRRFCGPTTVLRFRRVILLAQTQDGRVLLKLFKDILLRDLKIVSPAPQIRMPFFDRIKIGSSLLGGILTPLLKLLLAAAFSPILFLMVLFGFVMAFVKGILSFFSCRTKYMRALSTNLYYQGLANNACVLNRLVNTAEEEEVKEMLLAYYILHLRKETETTQEELDRAVESWLHETFGLKVDFEVDDALRKLQEKELVEIRETPTGKSYQALDIKTALRTMDQMWDNIFPFANEQ